MGKSFAHRLAIFAVFAFAHVSSAAAPTGPEADRFFEEKVRPVLEANCIKCHGDEKTKGNLKLTSRDAILAGGDTGPAVVLDQPAKSLLIDAIGYKNDKLQMPAKEKLPQDQIDILTKWVEMGLPFPASLEKPAAQPAATHTPPKVDDKARQFWSFKPVVRPAVPELKDTAWVTNPIDAFVLSKLDAKGLEPAPFADKITLIRRATYDLTGLPPTLAEVDAFVADASPDAYTKLVDRLLASPRYGEKWGRHWLDLVRFAETNSYERDSKKPNAWRYRDYVIRAFNNDTAYDRFVREQLAGDEMPEAATNSDPIIATGFYRLGIFDDEPVDREQSRYDNLDDIVQTVGNVFLGVTIDCARCHDHKIDPIPQTDYYKLLAFFQNINDYRNGGPTDEREIAVSESEVLAVRQRQATIEQLTKELRETEEIFAQLISGERDRSKRKIDNLAQLLGTDGVRVLGKERADKYFAAKRKLTDVSASKMNVPAALCVTERGPRSPDTFVLGRGSAHAPGAKVEPGFLEVVDPTTPVIPTPAADAKSSGRRTVLANWIVSPKNPLTTRVMVNRLWQYHFGRGIVRSSSDFGYQGVAPTHPELLDWLASEFVERGWSMKQMHRLIMLSSVYRMSSASNEKALTADPRNDLMWRFDSRRLSSEEIRDSVLAVNGTLNLTMYGPGIYPAIPKSVMQGQSRPGEGWGKSDPQEAARRSIYIHQKRSLRVPILQAFDEADPDKSCPVRFVTVQPTQALSMLNGEFLNEEAMKLAERLRKDAGDGLAKQVSLGLRLVTSREPSAAEVERGVKLVRSLMEKEGAKPERAMQYLGLVLLNLNEFVVLD